MKKKKQAKKSAKPKAKATDRYVTVTDGFTQRLICSVKGMRIKHRINGHTKYEHELTGVTHGRLRAADKAESTFTTTTRGDWWFVCDGSFPIRVHVDDMKHIVKAAKSTLKRQ